MANDQETLTRPAGAARDIGRLSLHDIRIATQGFYAAEGYHVVPAPGGGYQSVVRYGENFRTIASGAVSGLALLETLSAMHRQETVHTQAILSLEMEGGATVDFTRLEDYAPKIAPSNKIYEVPPYLTDILKDRKESMGTYEATTAAPDWASQLFGIVDTFLQSPQGSDLVGDLKITSLHALTPEQATKLSLATVQRLSKYTTDAAGQPDGMQADKSTTMELLQQGTERMSDPRWAGNGVCRNIGCNVKAVFEALKENQGNLSMLHNTYSVYAGGSGGEGYQNEREDFGTLKLTGDGHAWNTFVTIDAKGSASITIADATWAEAEKSVVEADYTMERMANWVRPLFGQSADKTRAFRDLNDYYLRLSRSTPGEQPKARERKNAFVLTEYLKAASNITEDMSRLSIRAPMVITTTALKLQDKLDPSEIATLYKMAEASWIFDFDTILEGYVNGTNNVLRGGASKIHSLVSHDDGLQSAIYDTLGSTRVDEYAEENGKFRARLRSLRPELLPEFDPAINLADQKELAVLAADQAGLHIWNKAKYGAELRKSLRHIATDDQAYERLVAGKTDYALLTGYRVLANELRSIARNH